MTEVPLQDPFDEETKKEYKVAGKTLTMRPMKLSVVKRVISMVEAGFTELGKMSTGNSLGDFGAVIEKNKDKILLELFPKTTHDFFDEKFIEENMTIPMVQRIFRDAMALNGISDFFDNLKKMREVAGKG